MQELVVEKAWIVRSLGDQLYHALEVMRLLRPQRGRGEKRGLLIERKEDNTV
jgi:hypothetical protein